MEQTYLHYDLNLKINEVAEVTPDKQANVRLLDEANFLRYQRGERYKYYGGRAAKSPVRLTPPQPGLWHVVIDIGGYAVGCMPLYGL